jgi:uncharacterized protein with HEPN domain
MSKHDPKIRLLHMRDFAQKAVQLTEGKTRADLEQDEVLRLAVTRLLELVGEAATHVPIEMRERNPEIPWPKIVSMRNRLIHGYEDVDYAVLWDALTFNLPDLLPAARTSPRARNRLMPTHDIIDNRNQRLADHVNRILATTDSARFAVGYFFFSALTSIAERLAVVKELRLLIGNTTNRETLEQIAEGYRRLELVAERVEEQNYPRRTDSRNMAGKTAEKFRESVKLMDQTGEGERLVKTLARMIEEKRVRVRVYTKGQYALRPGEGSPGGRRIHRRLIR